MGFFFIYILYCSFDGTFYIGLTDNLSRTVCPHLTGKARSTKNKQPMILLHYEGFRSKLDAKARARYLKSERGREEIFSFLTNGLKSSTIVSKDEL